MLQKPQSTSTQSAHQIQSRSIYNFLRYPAHKQTDKQTNRQGGVKTLPPPPKVKEVMKLANKPRLDMVPCRSDQRVNIKMRLGLNRSASAEKRKGIITIFQPNVERHANR